MLPPVCKNHDRLNAASIFIIACAVFFVSLHNQFALDDLIHIVQNSAIRSSAAWETLFTSASYPGNLFRPLTNLSYALTFNFFGLSALPYHVTNVILHAAASTTLFYVLVRIGMRQIGLAAALLFALHPLHVEAVANVSGRAELLAAFFGLMSLHFFLSFTHKRSVDMAIIAALALLAGLLCKESAIVFLPLAALLLCVQPRSLKQSALGFVCLGLACVIFIVWRAAVLGTVAAATSDTEFLDNPLASLSLAQRVPIALALLGKYASLCFYPFPLSADYSFAVIDPAIFWGSPENWFNVLLVAALSSLVFVLRKDKEIFFFSAWFLLSFAVTANIFFPIGTIFGERLCYVPSLGVIGLLVVAAKRYLPSWIGKKLLLVLGAIYAVQAVNHSAVWKDNQSLHTYQLRVSPESAKTLVNYGMVLRNRGEADAAAMYFRQAMEIYPQFANAAYGLGSSYALKGMQSGAEHWYYEALKRYPVHAPSLEALGRLYLNNGKNADARAQFEKILSSDPTSVGAKLGMLALNLNEGNLEQARQLRTQLETLARDNPEFKLLSEQLEKLTQ